MQSALAHDVNLRKFIELLSLFRVNPIHNPYSIKFTFENNLGMYFILPAMEGISQCQANTFLWMLKAW